jgi:hypothetical protein
LQQQQQSNQQPSGQQLVVVAVICCFLTGSSTACDYQRLDPSHTMCVYTPRSCGGKTLIRELFLFFNFYVEFAIMQCAYYQSSFVEITVR